MKITLTIDELNPDQARALVSKAEELRDKEIQSRFGNVTEVETTPSERFEQVHGRLNCEPVEESTVDFEIDSQGLPWDGRIHAGSKTKNKDGSWKKKRGIEDEEFYRIAGEIRNANNAAAQKEVRDVAPAPQPAPAEQPAPSLPKADEAKPTRDFQGLMQQISVLFSTKSIQPDYPNTIVSRVNAGFKTNATTLPDLANDARMVEYAWQCLDVDNNGVGHNQ